MKVLMVGCGAVGQVFGFHLQQAGVELAFYARSGTADKLQTALEDEGLPLYQLSHFHRGDPAAHRLAQYQVVTDIAESRRFNPDQIWFTTPSPVYYSEWFREFVLQVPCDQVVCFAPEGGRAEFFPEGAGPQGAGKDRFVFGGITFITWQGDLGGGGGRPEGVNFWLPPLLEIPVMGAEETTREVVGLLRQAGLRAAPKEREFYKMQASLTAAMTALVAGLELSGWSFKALRWGPWLKPAARGGREAVLSQLPGDSRLTKALLGLLLSAVGIFLISLILPLLFPFKVEAYLRFHYQKTREQTLTLLAVFVSDGKRRGRPVENVQRLLDGLHDGA
jgi:2-dehydropantoate 2-reductase